MTVVFRDHVAYGSVAQFLSAFRDFIPVSF